MSGNSDFEDADWGTWRHWLLMVDCGNSPEILASRARVGSLDANTPDHSAQMLSRREATPSTAIPPSLEVSYQSQLNDLVQRNQALEQTHGLLSDQLATEVARSKATALQIKQQWHLEQSQWSKAWEFIHCCHRVVQRRAEIDLENERISSLKESDAMRKEKLARLNRDYRITSFQIRERELEGRIYELENAKGALIGECEDEVASLQQQYTSLQSQLLTQASTLAITKGERDKSEVSNKLPICHHVHDPST